MANPKFEAWLEVEEWLQAESNRYDDPKLQAAVRGTALEQVANSTRNLLQDLANRAARRRLEAGRKQ